LFLKSIELFGFKSFADRTRIEFSGGVSALLGPNGCGKSNVVDAVKWVLGEQATKSLRAGRMEDVIFNGTESRKAMNVADVTLTFANDAGILPIDVPEVSVRRRLFRTGESEYYINNNPVKLKELRELFYDTGIGKRAYSIMEQGKIDQILSNHPDERRHIFEEAATITKYKLKGQEAERKLERTEENMRQVDSILGEVKRSYDTLEKQAEKTNQYRELRDRIFDLEVERELLRLRRLHEDRNKKQSQLERKTTRRDEVKEQIDRANEYVEGNLDEVHRMESRLVELQKSVYGKEIEKGNLDSRIRMMEERVRELKEELSAHETRTKAEHEKIQAAQNEVEQRTQSIEEHGRRLAQVKENITDFSARVDNAANRISENQEQIDALHTEIAQLEEETEALHEELRSLTDRIVHDLDARLRESGYSAATRKRAEDALQEALAAHERRLRGRRDRLRDEVTLAGADPERVSAAAEDATQGLEEALGSLEELKESIESFRASVPSVIDELLAPEGTMTRKREIDGRLEAIRTRIREARGTIDTRRAENAELQQKIDQYRATLEELRLTEMQAQTQLQAEESARDKAKSQIAEHERAIEEQKKAYAATEQRLQELHSGIETEREKRRQVEEAEEAARKELAEVQQSISSRNEELERKENEVKGMSEELARVQGEVERLQVQLAETNAEIRNVYSGFSERHGRDLSEYESRIFEMKRAPQEVRDELAAVREEQRKLGSVNLMAPEEFAEVKERYDFLNEQLEDLRKAKSDLLQVTNEIRSESAELFLTTYEKIKRNFHTMFRRLFGGGRAELQLTDPDNVLESGVEILAQPPGKKLESIALLSGGERSLTAIALLFATYMVKPSPFCILDEIDAALDDTNVGRFVGMLDEFGKSSQFIIITHNKKTVTGARTLLGITMEENGLSKVVAIRLDNREPAHV